jgi:hypothetical protein
VDVAELMPCHPSESGPFRSWLQHVAKQLRLAERLTAAVPEQEIVGCGARRAKAMERAMACGYREVDTA